MDATTVHAVTAQIEPALLPLLACPQCRAELEAEEESLSCRGCHATYRVDQGIPILLPDTFDVEHLREEESLALKMRERGHLPEMRFNTEQWAQSKRDFWDMVQSNVVGTGKHFVNLGCGYDSSYTALEARGHVFVNFDMVLGMLRTLQSRFSVNGDLNRLPFRSGSFDYVVSIDVIHHECDRLPELLSTFRDLLKPGGTLFLEDPNAWGLFQMAKSIFMPRPVYRYLRATYHRARQTEHRPADYEFPTNVWGVSAILRKLGFEDIRIYPQSAYPTISAGRYRLYNWLSGSRYVRTYHNYHYMLSAVRSAAA